MSPAAKPAGRRPRTLSDMGMARSRKRRPPSKDSLRTPWAFAQDILGLDVYDYQLGVMQEMARPMGSAAWGAAFGSGKTLTLAVLELWVPCAYEHGICIDTATGFKQVRDTWAEIHRLLASPFVREIERKHFGGKPLFECLEATRFAPYEASKAFRYSQGQTAETVDAFQGRHTGTWLFGVNEAQAVGQHIHEAIDNSRAAGDIRRFLIGNTTVGTGEFFDAFHSKRNAYKAFRTTVWDTPNLYGLNAERLMALSDEEIAHSPYPTVSRAWVREKLETWGETSPLWKVKCLAEFPELDQWQLISAAWIDECERKLAEIDRTGPAWTRLPIVVGIDPGGGAMDELAAYALRENAYVSSLFSAAKDPRGELLAWLASLGGKEAIREIRYDPVGVGHYIGPFLSGHGYRMVAVHPQHPSTEPERFRWLKDQLYWQVREGFEKGKLVGISDSKTQAELASLRWFINDRGLTEMEHKSARGGHARVTRESRGEKSPNRAEAVILAYTPNAGALLNLFGRGGLNDVPDREEDDRYARTPLAGLVGMRF